MRAALIAASLFAVGFANPVRAGSLSLPHFLNFRDVHAYVTGYNTVPGQTDDTPCIAASGANICGRTDAVACPRRISLGTFLAIRGEIYVCEDRLAKKYDSRFDISCDKDTDCPAQVTGWADIKVFAQNPCRLESPARPAVAALERPLLRLAAFVPRHLLVTARQGLALHFRPHGLRRA
ncbi:MAG TPA: hypothetical protein VG651_19150 [Stellaceae bacterium]|nr:hypothetical protein [Stellaceae bacterium]